MIDLRFLREHPDVVRASQRSRGADPALVDALLSADVSRRAAVATADRLRAEQKALGKQVGKASPDERSALLASAGQLAAKVKEAEAVQSAADAELDSAARALDNVIIDGVPAGGEENFVVVDEVGEPTTFDFEPRDHLALGESLGLIDMQRGAKVAGSRFYFLTGNGALLQLGMLQLAAQKAAANGFTLMIPPVLVRPEVMAGTGFLGAHAEEVYRLEADDLYLVGTSEVPLAGYYAMARNLVFEVRRHYDEALSRFDVLVMPTLPMVATPIPAASDPREVQIARALEMIPNTAPFDISGHPAISVPAGLADGLPVGMMIVGKRFDDAACLRVAHAFERLSGGFPAPPGAA